MSTRSTFFSGRGGGGGPLSTLAFLIHGRVFYYGMSLSFGAKFDILGSRQALGLIVILG